MFEARKHTALIALIKHDA